MELCVSSVRHMEKEAPIMDSGLRNHFTSGNLHSERICSGISLGVLLMKQTSFTHKKQMESWVYLLQVGPESNPSLKY